jgi:vesicle-fusing ATPase
MTVLEITHSLTDWEISALERSIASVLEKVTDYTYDHRARLVKPMIGFDTSALALSFVPAAGEGDGPGWDAKTSFTYHHLRRDLYEICEGAGTKVASRYVVPSSHLTIARFVNETAFTKADGAEVDHEKVAQWVALIEEMNLWLEKEFWPSAAKQSIPVGGEWTVGEGKGLVCRRGTVWYGGGTSAREGKGF